MKKRVVITGVGAVSPLGCGIEHVWRRILSGDCGISKLAMPKLPINVPVYLAATVPRGSEPYAYNEQEVFGRSVGKELALFSQYAIYASDLALEHARIDVKQMGSPLLERFGVTMSSGGVGSLEEILSAAAAFDVSYKKLSPYFTPKVLVNMAGGHISIRHGLKGPLHTVATACAAGTHAVGDAYNFIRLGYADCMLAGGTEACIDPLSIAGFARLRALSSSQDPFASSRPFDRDRSGFVMAEGACILVLEELQHALQRGATLLAEVVGYGLSSDAYQPTLPAPTGDGAIRSMKSALWDAGIQPSDIGYVNAHATSTAHGDAIEAAAVRTIFEDYDGNAVATPYISSTKGATGHLLGAAGALELAFTALALRDNIIPPTLNLYNLHQDVQGPFRHVFRKRHNLSELEQANFRFALKNSFGFGGTNASIILAKSNLRAT